PVALTGWLLAIATALAALYGLRGDIGGKHPSSVGVAALYNSVARSAWAGALCWLIVACVSGWGGFVNTFLSWSPFVVLGRLTYMAYLIHMCLMNIYFQSQDTLYYLTGFNIAVTFMAVLVATYGLSFIFMLGLESPMIGLEKVFLPKRRKD
ncbi:nose resistant to fluoxetine protein 6, partial [Plakobranchus ocellatus]